jgi:hypothetical protein
MKCANDLKFCTKISGLNLHQMVHLSRKNIVSPIMSKKKPQCPLLSNLKKSDVNIFYKAYKIFIIFYNSRKVYRVVEFGWLTCTLSVQY